jgi:hypothetical protein
MPRARNAIASTATRTPRIVTTRTPLFDEAGWREDGADLGEMRSDLFLPRNLDDPNHVEMANEIRSFAQRVWRCFGTRTVRSWAETLTDLPRNYVSALDCTVIPDAAASRSFSVCHLQLKPGVFLGFCFRYFDTDFLTQGIEITKQTVVGVTGKMPAQKF